MRKRRLPLLRRRRGLTRRLPNCKSYTISLKRIVSIIILYPNSYSWICIFFVFKQDLMIANLMKILSLRLKQRLMTHLLMTVNMKTIPSLRLNLRLLVNRQVMKMLTRRNNMRKTMKMFVQLGTSQIEVLE